MVNIFIANLNPEKAFHLQIHCVTTFDEIIEKKLENITNAEKDADTAVKEITNAKDMVAGEVDLSNRLIEIENYIEQLKKSQVQIPEATPLPTTTVSSTQSAISILSSIRLFSRSGIIIVVIVVIVAMVAAAAGRKVINYRRSK